MIRTIALLTATVLSTAMSGVTAVASLAGHWNTTFEQPMGCDKPVPLKITSFQFAIEDAPLLNRAASSFSYADANVTGAVSFTLQPRTKPYRPTMIVSGRLVGQIVKNAKAARERGTDGLMLQGYILDAQQYSEWVENKHKLPNSNVGEVEMHITGNAVQGYVLTGMVRLADLCENARPVAPSIQELTGNSGAAFLPCGRRRSP